MVPEPLDCDATQPIDPEISRGFRVGAPSIPRRPAPELSMDGSLLRRKLADDSRALLDLRAGEGAALELEASGRLPYATGSFDGVLAEFATMFAPDPQVAAGELLRIVRPGGRIGLRTWSSTGFHFQALTLLLRHAPSEATLRRPASWGSSEAIERIFASLQGAIEVNHRPIVLREESALRWLERLRGDFPAIDRTLTGIAPEQQETFRWDLLYLMASGNRSGDETLALPTDYVETVIRKPR